MLPSIFLLYILTMSDFMPKTIQTINKIIGYFKFPLNDEPHRTSHSFSHPRPTEICYNTEMLLKIYRRGKAYQQQ